MQDQTLSYYPCFRKSLRRYRKLEILALQMILMNSYFLYKKKNTWKLKISLYIFRLQIIEESIPPKQELRSIIKYQHVPGKFSIP